MNALTETNFERIMRVVDGAKSLEHCHM